MLKIRPKTLKLARDNWLFLSILLLLTIALIVIHGLYPTALQAKYSLLGGVECNSQALRSIDNRSCIFTGAPTGGLYTTEFPIIAIGALFAFLSTLNSLSVVFIEMIALITVSLLGAALFIRSFGVNKYISVTMGFIFLSSLGILEMSPFGGTYWSFILLPAALYAIRLLLSKIIGTKIIHKMLVVAIWTVLLSFMLFLDGYSFVLLSAATIMFILHWILTAKPKINELVFVVLVFFFASATAYSLYSAFIPNSNEWSSTPLDFFRSSGADASTFFIPPPSLWWSDLSPITTRPDLLWGDGSNSSGNYIGLSLLVISGLGLYSMLKKGTPNIRVLGVGILLVIILAGLLSLGPSLKWNSLRGPLTTPVTYSSYLMPAEKAVFTFPYSDIFTDIPGINSMRAIYRWDRLMYIFIFVLASIGIQAIHNKKGYRYTIPLLLIVVLELSVNPTSSIRANNTKGNEQVSFKNDVTLALGNYLKPGERVVFYPDASGGNDYLINIIAPSLHIYAYNVGGDKSLALARQNWPRDVQDLLLDEDNFMNKADTIDALLDSGTIDALVVPYFDLRWDSYSWPPRNNAAEQNANKVLESLSDVPGITVRKEGYFAVVRYVDR